MSRARTGLAAALLLLAACGGYTPPPPPAPRPATEVGAPASRTWQVALELLRADGADIRTADQATGTIVTREMIVPYRQRGVSSDCGGGDTGSNVVFTVRVTGDETRSAVQAAGRFTLRGLGRISQCTTKDFWERNLETRIRDRAEQR